MYDTATAERRKPARKKAQLRALAVSPDGMHKVDCRIEDISEVGARVFVNKGQVIPEQSYFVVAGRETAHEAIVAWVKGQEYGLSFVNSFQLESVKDTPLAFLRRLKLERLRV